MTEENYFKKLMKLQGEVHKKRKLNYISWADAWKIVKEQYPQANYIVATNPATGMPYFHDKTGGFVKVTVTVENVSHSCFLPIMNQPKGQMMAAVKEEDIDAFAINKTIQRALTKAIALHGICLYVYLGEDLPEGVEDKVDTVEKARAEGRTPGVPKDKQGAKFNCIDCGVEITEAEHNYSTDKMKKALCRSCQDKHRKG